MAFSLPAASLSALVLSSVVAAQCPDGEVRSPQPFPYDRFGAGLSVHGDRVAVTETKGPADNYNYAVSIYRLTVAGLALEATITVPSTGGGTSASVGLGEDTLMVGKPTQGGRVHVYREIGGAWVPTQVLKPNDLVGDAGFGWRIRIWGTTAAVSAHADGTLVEKGGAVYIYEEQGGSWVQTQRIDPTPTYPNGGFGSGLALNDNFLIIGEPVVSWGDTPKVYAYRRSANGWVLRQVIDGLVSNYGRSVDLEDGRLVIGAKKAVHVYELNSGIWELAEDVRRPGTDKTGFGFGSIVTLSGNMLAVSENGPTLFADPRVHLFETKGNGFEHLTTHDSPGTPLETTYGISIAFIIDHFLIGETMGKTLVNGGVVHILRRNDPTDNYCGPANLNSTGGSGVLNSTGCTTVEQNILAFRASSLPQGQWGYFLASPTQAFIPFVGGSGGNLCLGPPLGRYASQVNSTGTVGELTLMVDVETIPTPGGPHHAQPGETWNFQAWYRDMNPGPTSNFTDAISVTWR